MPTSDERHQPLVDFTWVRRCIGVVGAVWAAVAVLGAVVSAGLGGGLSAAAVRLWLGVAALGTVVSAVGLVAWSALGGMVRAGDRGDRLAGDDVGLLPPRR
ncbi:MAG: hypothetical protein M3N57_13690, partial [Actinomycetota bacterium]|nr:hypothetical protein [Actinomycetota bacterium]